MVAGSVNTRPPAAVWAAACHRVSGTADVLLASVPCHFGPPRRVSALQGSGVVQLKDHVLACAVQGMWLYDKVSFPCCLRPSIIAMDMCARPLPALRAPPIRPCAHACPHRRHSTATAAAAASCGRSLARRAPLLAPGVPAAAVLHGVGVLAALAAANPLRSALCLAAAARGRLFPRCSAGRRWCGGPSVRHAHAARARGARACRSSRRTSLC